MQAAEHKWIQSERALLHSYFHKKSLNPDVTRVERCTLSMSHLILGIDQTVFVVFQRDRSCI